MTTRDDSYSLVREKQLDARKGTPAEGIQDLMGEPLNRGSLGDYAGKNSYQRRDFGPEDNVVPEDDGMLY